MDHRHGQFAALDYDFCACTYPGQHRSEVAGGFCFRDVDQMVGHAAIILPFLVVLAGCLGNNLRAGNLGKPQVTWGGPDCGVEARQDGRQGRGLESIDRTRANTLELAFETKSLRTICESEAQARLELGAEVAEILKHRLADMRAATCTNDLVAGQPRLSADGEQMVVDLCDGYRIVFKANHTRNPLTEAKDVDWPKVIRIKILRIESDDD